MTEIKFRFWDTVEKKWMVDGRSETDIYDFAFKPNMNWHFLTKEQAQKRVIVEQYTGLKDKNGKKEVYHKDITEDVDGDKYLVEWNEKEACYYLKGIGLNCLGLKTVDLEIIDIKEQEVIGDIHTTPELMEQKEG